MRRATGYSRTALSEAAGGGLFLSWVTVEVFVTVCGRVRWWLDHWRDIPDQVRRGAVPPRSAPATAEPEPATLVAVRRPVPVPCLCGRRRCTLWDRGEGQTALTRQRRTDPGCPAGTCVYLAKDDGQTSGHCSCPRDHQEHGYRDGRSSDGSADLVAQPSVMVMGLRLSASWDVDS